jgi:MFS family permease
MQHSSALMQCGQSSGLSAVLHMQICSRGRPNTPTLPQIHWLFSAIMPLITSSCADPFHPHPTQGWRQQKRTCTPTTMLLPALQIPGGWAAQRWGGRRTLIASFLCWSLACLVTPGSASNVGLIVAARVAVGLAQGGVIPSIHTVLSQVGGGVECKTCSSRTGRQGCIQPNGQAGRQAAGALLGGGWMCMQAGNCAGKHALFSVKEQGRNAGRP